MDSRYDIPVWLAKEIFDAHQDDETWDFWGSDDVLKYIVSYKNGKKNLDD